MAIYDKTLTLSGYRTLQYRFSGKCTHCASDDLGLERPGEYEEFIEGMRCRRCPNGEYKKIDQNETIDYNLRKF